jgi:hypothetical protein
MIRDAQNPTQMRAGQFTHTAVIGTAAKAGASDHTGNIAGAADNNFPLFSLKPGDVVRQNVLIDLLTAYVGAGPAATSVSLVVGTTSAGAGGTVVATLTDVRAATPRTVTALAAGIDYVNGTAADVWVTARFTGLATATVGSATAGTVGLSLNIVRAADRFAGIV